MLELVRICKLQTPSHYALNHDIEVIIILSPCEIDSYLKLTSSIHQLYFKKKIRSHMSRGQFCLIDNLLM